MSNLKPVLAKFYDEYVNNTPKKLKLIDAYLLYIVLTGVTQFVYCCLVGTFPFNSFLSGFISTISCFVLGGKSCDSSSLILLPIKYSITLNHSLLQLQFAYVCKQIPKISCNLLAYRPNVVSPISFWRTQFCISSWWTSLDERFCDQVSKWYQQTVSLNIEKCKTLRSCNGKTRSFCHVQTKSTSKSSNKKTKLSEENIRFYLFPMKLRRIFQIRNFRMKMLHHIGEIAEAAESDCRIFGQPSEFSVLMR